MSIPPPVSNLSTPSVSNLCLHHQCQTCVFTTNVKPMSTSPVSNQCLYHHQCQTYVYTTTSVKPMSTPPVSNLCLHHQCQTCPMSTPPVSNQCLHHQCQTNVYTTSVKPMSGVQKLGPELHQYSRCNVIKDQAKFENKHGRSSASVQPTNDPSPQNPLPATPHTPPPSTPTPPPPRTSGTKVCLDLGAVVIHQLSQLPFQRFVGDARSVRVVTARSVGPGSHPSGGVVCLSTLSPRN